MIAGDTVFVLSTTIPGSMTCNSGSSSVDTCAGGSTWEDNYTIDPDNSGIGTPATGPLMPIVFIGAAPQHVLIKRFQMFRGAPGIGDYVVVRHFRSIGECYFGRGDVAATGMARTGCIADSMRLGNGMNFKGAQYCTFQNSIIHLPLSAYAAILFRCNADGTVFVNHATGGDVGQFTICSQHNQVLNNQVVYDSVGIEGKENAVLAIQCHSAFNLFQNNQWHLSLKSKAAGGTTHGGGGVYIMYDSPRNQFIGNKATVTSGGPTGASDNRWIYYMRDSTASNTWNADTVLADENTDGRWGKGDQAGFRIAEAGATGVFPLGAKSSGGNTWQNCFFKYKGYFQFGGGGSNSQSFIRDVFANTGRDSTFESKESGVQTNDNLILIGNTFYGGPVDLRHLNSTSVVKCNLFVRNNTAGPCVDLQTNTHYQDDNQFWIESGRDIKVNQAVRLSGASYPVDRPSPWTTTMGHDTRSRFQDPNFTDTSFVTMDLTPKYGSPAYPPIRGTMVGHGAISVFTSRQSGQVDQVLAQKFTPGGHLQWKIPVTNLASNGILAQANPVAVPDLTGGVLVFWQDSRSGAVDLYGQRITAAGTRAWGSGGIALSLATGTQGNPFACQDGEGGAFVVWEDARGAAKDIYGARIDSLGINRWTSQGQPICVATAIQSNPKVSPDGTGGCYIVWEDSRGGVDQDIYATRMRANGQRGWATADGDSLCAFASDQKLPDVTRDSTGQGVFAWQDARTNATKSTDIYAACRDSAGANPWSGLTTAVCDTATAQTAPKVFPSKGGTIVAWKDARAVYSRIYSQRMLSTGVKSYATDGLFAADSAGTTASAMSSFGSSDSLGGVLLLGASTIQTKLVHMDASGNYSTTGGNGGMRIESTPRGSILNGYALCPDMSAGAYVSYFDNRDKASPYSAITQHVAADNSLRFTPGGMNVAALSDTTGVTDVAMMVPTRTADESPAWVSDCSGYVGALFHDFVPPDTCTNLNCNIGEKFISTGPTTVEVRDYGDFSFRVVGGDDGSQGVPASIYVAFWDSPLTIANMGAHLILTEPAPSPPISRFIPEFEFGPPVGGTWYFMVKIIDDAGNASYSRYSIPHTL